jgi:Putative MetA-pathway of phenol degradation
LELNNFMTYIATDVPLGYDASSLANLSIGHYAIDGGGAYTYLDSQAGNEFSAIAGVTYNFVNPYTDYRNGVDFHFDWGASHFLTKQLLVGAVGYVYHQLTGDSGRRPSRLLHVACRRRRPADRLFLSARRLPGIPEPQGVRRIRRPRSGQRLQCLADADDFIACADPGFERVAAYDTMVR